MDDRLAEAEERTSSIRMEASLEQVGTVIAMETFTLGGRLEMGLLEEAERVA